MECIKKNPMVSVIIPTYKRSDMLPRAIASVLGQTYSNIQVVVVDDNNPDTEYRNNTAQSLVLRSLKWLPCKWLAKKCYQTIYKYDGMTSDYQYCYWITPAKFRNGLFDADFFSDPVDVPFEDTVLLGSKKIKEYLTYRYGDYRKLPPEEQQKEAIHAMVYDTQKDYSHYFREGADR